MEAIRLLGQMMGQKQPKIVLNRINTLPTYEVTEEQLDLLCQEGGVCSVYLNLSILFITAATAFLTPILTVTIESHRMFTLFVVVVLVGYAVGGVLLVLWAVRKRSRSEILRRITGRAEPEDAV